MAFTSLPIYLDPLNWNQPNQQTQNADQQSHMFISSTTNNNESTEETQNPSNTSSMAKPGSMAERARLAKIPQPEPALKCPRCDSTNTKFCYFNNYSLSQPRHFCKTCRRYWTRGGALRSVPVGGGCRRNKRGSNSKSSANKSGATSSAAVSSSSNCSTATSGSGLLPSNFSQFPLLSSLHPLADQLGFNFSMMQQQSIDANEYQLGGNINVQQFPFMDNTSVMSGINYGNFHGEVGSDNNQLGFHMPMKISSGATNLGLITQMASVKMEDSHAQGMNLSRQYLGISGNDPYMSGLWDGNGNGNGNGSGFHSASAGNLL